MQISATISRIYGGTYGGGEYEGSVGNVVVATDAHVLGVTCETLLVAVPVGNPSGS